MTAGNWRVGLKAFEAHLEACQAQAAAAAAAVAAAQTPRRRGASRGEASPAPAAAAAAPLPTLATFHTVVRGLCRARQVDAAVAVLYVALRASTAPPSASSGAAATAAAATAAAPATPPLVVADEGLCCAVLDLCAETGRMELAEGVVEAMSGAHVPVGAIAYCVLIKGYGRQRRAHMVDAALRAMRRARVEPDVIALNAAVDAYVRCGDLRRARGVVRAMEGAAEQDAAAAAGGSGDGAASGGAAAAAPAMAVAPNTRTYNTLIKGLGKAGRLEEAFEVAATMRSHGATPNAVTTNSLVDACVRCGDLKRAHQLLAGACDAAAEAAAAGVSGPAAEPPSVFAFTTVLTGYANAGDMEGALAVLERMETAGVAANLVTHTALIGSAVKAGALREARRLFEGLKIKGRTNPSLRPNTITYNTLISGLCRAGADESFAAYAAALTEGSGGGGDGDSAGGSGGGGALPASTAAWRAEGAAAAQDALPSADDGDGVEDEDDRALMAPVATLPGGVREALRLLLDMRRAGVPPSETTMNAILDGIVSLSPPHMTAAASLRDLMTSWGLSPNSITYSIMIKGHGRAGDLSGARDAFAALLSDPRVCPDVVALNSFLDACVRCGDLPLALATLSRAARNLRGGGSRAGGSGGSGGSGDVDDEPSVMAAAAGDAVPGSPAPTPAKGSVSAAARAAAAIVAALPPLDISPNTVSYSTVVLGLARSANIFSGRKAMALYYDMRARGLLPDGVMVDGLLRACCNARARRGALTPADGRRILSDLRSLGWRESVLDEKAAMLEAAVPAISEVWKERADVADAEMATEGSARGARRGRSGSGDKRAAASNKASDKIFAKYRWNEIESRFRLF